MKHPASEVRGGWEKPPCAQGQGRRSHPEPKARGGSLEEPPTPEARADGQEEQLEERWLRRHRRA